MQDTSLQHRDRQVGELEVGEKCVSCLTAVTTVTRDQLGTALRISVLPPAAKCQCVIRAPSTDVVGGGVKLWRCFDPGLTGKVELSTGLREIFNT